jgi:hypothetical protein
VVRYAPEGASAYDRVYASKVFSFSPASDLDPERMSIGGSGWDRNGRLPLDIERLPPHYGLYPDWQGNIGFTVRGCRSSCGFCLVPGMEGRPRPVATIAELLVQPSRFLVLLDNDFFGNPLWRERVKEIHDHDLVVNFSQGFNVRIIAEEQARALADLCRHRRITNLSRTRGQFHFAWDRPRDEERVLAGIQRLFDAGIKPWRMACFVLIGFDTTPEQDEHRVLQLRRWGIDPYVMPYNKTDPYQAAFARWVNRRPIFNSVPSFAEYSTGMRGQRWKGRTTTEREDQQPGDGHGAD